MIEQILTKLETSPAAKIGDPFAQESTFADNLNPEEPQVEASVSEKKKDAPGSSDRNPFILCDCMTEISDL